MRRPEVSSALAAVVDRATAKDLGRRYHTDAELIEDLEDVLAIETARSGQATGEATAVLRTLPPGARRGVPWRVLHPARIVAVLALIGAVVAVAAVLMATKQRTERGTGTRNVKPPPGLRSVSLGQSRAKDFDPFGGDGEHPTEAKAVVDQDTQSTWSTEATIDQTRTRTRVRLDTNGKRYRYYLVWITKLPPEQSTVQIAEIRLFRLGSA
jgi:hypothetical protein